MRQRDLVLRIVMSLLLDKHSYMSSGLGERCTQICTNEL